jgi:hypothetical protein
MKGGDVKDVQENRDVIVQFLSTQESSQSFIGKVHFQNFRSVG